MRLVPLCKDTLFFTCKPRIYFESGVYVFLFGILWYENEPDKM